MIDEMTFENIRLLIKGIDFWKEHKPIHLRIVG